MNLVLVICFKLHMRIRCKKDLRNLWQLHGEARHCELQKPANVLWLTNSMAWRILDMGIVAAIGTFSAYIIYCSSMQVFMAHAEFHGRHALTHHH